VRYPFLPPLIAFASGILISHAATFEVRETLLATVALLLLTLLARRHARAVGYASGLITFVLAGIFIDVVHRPGPAPVIDASSQETVLISGCVVEPTIFNEGRDQFTLELARNVDARVTLSMRDGETPPDLRYGQPVELEAHVRPIRNFHNPGSFDFEKYSARRHIFWNASARSSSPVRVLPGHCGSPLRAGIFALRTAGLRRLESLYQGNPYATAMMEAILLGESAKLQKIWTDHFRRTGTFHAIVIAGLHVSVLSGFFLLILRVCLVPRLASLFVTTGATWIYALVAGWNAPVVRAAAGLTFYLAARYFYRRGRVVNLLAAAAVGFLLHDPEQILDASFQLSFLSVAAIAILAGPIMDATSAPFARNLAGINETRRDLRMPPKAAQFRVELRLLAQTVSQYFPVRQEHVAAVLALLARIVLYCYDMALISTMIQIGLALPMAIYFHRISLSGFSANILIVPLLALVMPIGFVAMFTGWHLPAVIAQYLLIASEKIASWHVHFEPEMRIPDPPLWLSLSFVAALLAVAFTMRKSFLLRWPPVAVVLGLFAVLLIYPFPPQIHPNQFEFSAIDVGQGDSLFLAFPDGKLMLIDGGGVPVFGRQAKPKLDIGEDVVSPYLWSRCIRHLDIIACTHAHEDHMGGLPALIDNFHPRELWTGANPDSPIWRTVQQHARERGVKIRHLCAGESMNFGATRIEVLSPPGDYVLEDAPKNNDSLALRISYSKRAFMFTGDMEWPMEARILGDERMIRADVLKVGHHGSRTSSTNPFLDAVTPTFAVISNGFENSFHHPNGETLERLAAHHAGILRTDTDGLITLRTDGDRLFLETFRYRREYDGLKLGRLF